MSPHVKLPKGLEGGGGIGSIEWEWDWYTNDGILPDLKGIFIEAHEWERKTERISYDDRK